MLKRREDNGHIVKDVQTNCKISFSINAMNLLDDQLRLSTFRKIRELRECLIWSNEKEKKKWVGHVPDLSSVAVLWEGHQGPKLSVIRARGVQPVITVMQRDGFAATARLL